MKTRNILLVATLILCLGFTFQSKPTQWEYKIVSDSKVLNKLGAEGWELVSIKDNVAGGTSFRTDYYLKRPLLRP
jgi:hypothetical protein